MSLKEKKMEANRVKQIRDFQRAIPLNKRCFDCNEMMPQYLCLDFNTFICTACGGIHREFAHRVKSISMSTFSESEVKNIVQLGGNEIAEKFWHANLDPSERGSRSKNRDRIRNFIRSTYIDRKWVFEPQQEGDRGAGGIVKNINIKKKIKKKKKALKEEEDIEFFADFDQIQTKNSKRENKPKNVDKADEIEHDFADFANFDSFTKDDNTTSFSGNTTSSSFDASNDNNNTAQEEPDFFASFDDPKNDLFADNNNTAFNNIDKENPFDANDDEGFMCFSSSTAHNDDFADFSSSAVSSNNSNNSNLVATTMPDMFDSFQCNANSNSISSRSNGNINVEVKKEEDPFSAFDTLSDCSSSVTTDQHDFMSTSNSDQIANARPQSTGNFPNNEANGFISFANDTMNPLNNGQMQNVVSDINIPSNYKYLSQSTITNSLNQQSTGQVMNQNLSQNCMNQGYMNHNSHNNMNNKSVNQNYMDQNSMNQGNINRNYFNQPNMNQYNSTIPQSNNQNTIGLSNHMNSNHPNFDNYSGGLQHYSSGGHTSFQQQIKPSNLQESCNNEIPSSQPPQQQIMDPFASLSLTKEFGLPSTCNNHDSSSFPQRPPQISCMSKESPQFQQSQVGSAVEAAGNPFDMF